MMMNNTGNSLAQLPPLDEKNIKLAILRPTCFKKRASAKKNLVNANEFHEQCNYLGCESVFKSRFNLRRHVLLCHTNLRPFECEICGRRFGLNQHRLDHLLTHELDPHSLREMIQKRVSLRSSLPIFRVELADGKETKLPGKRVEPTNALEEYIAKWNGAHFLESRILALPEAIKEKI
mmetsp:Transcript_40788/g.46917  ORF Transcript_40788/g.46917 Transcript_40788/m.46917 type:complete len:178 (-) Transcript_40788:50-583(-)